MAHLCFTYQLEDLMFKFFFIKVKTLAEQGWTGVVSVLPPGFGRETTSAMIHSLEEQERKCISIDSRCWILA